MTCQRLGSPACSASSYADFSTLVVALLNLLDVLLEILIFIGNPSHRSLLFLLDPTISPPINPFLLHVDVTYTAELRAAVTALGNGALLLDVKVSESATGGLDDADLVGFCRIAELDDMLVAVFNMAKCRVCLTPSACDR